MTQRNIGKRFRSACVRKGIRKHSQCYSHTLENILANVQIWYSRQIRQKSYDWPGELLKQMRPYKCLRMLANFLRILANFIRSLRLLNNQFAEFLVNPLRMLRILTANVLLLCCAHGMSDKRQLHYLFDLRVPKDALYMKNKCACDDVERLN